MPTYYHIRLKGHLDDHWSAWFGNLTMYNEANGELVLRGPLADQAALHGVLIKIRDLGLPLIAVSTVAADQSPHGAHCTTRTARRSMEEHPDSTVHRPHERPFH